MNAAVSINDHLSLLTRDPFAAVRGTGPDTRVVGYVGSDIPVELILAAGAIPLRLRGSAQEKTPHADRYLESAFAPELRVIAEQWLTGALDPLQSVVLSRSDDSAQRLYYYICELQHRGMCGGPEPVLYDVATLPRHTSIAHTLESTRRLAAELGAQGDLRAAIDRVVRRERLLERIAARRTSNSPLAGSLGWRLNHVSGYDWRESFDTAAQAWLDDAPAVSPRRRVVLAGNSPPDAQLHLTVEAAGGSIVSEQIDSFAPHRSQHADPLTDIAQHVQQCNSVAVSMRQNPQWLVDCARAARADAVVAWLIEEDESLPWEISRQMRALQDAGVPALLLSRQSWRPTADALAQVQTFVSDLEADA